MYVTRLRRVKWVLRVSVVVKKCMSTCCKCVINIFTHPVYFHIHRLFFNKNATQQTAGLAYDLLRFIDNLMKQLIFKPVIQTIRPQETIIG